MTANEPMTAAIQHARCDELAAAVLAYCEDHHFVIAAAESLTGGLLADAFVRIPGASKVFLGSVVTYDIRAKSSILGVDAGLLAREGAVHPEVARRMAEAAAGLYAQPEDGDRVVGLSTTGVAGPGPDGDKPAGLVYIGFSVPDGFGGVRSRRTIVFELRLQGTREQVRMAVVQRVLQKLSSLSAISQE
jgi:nicotinamide-nucleotide amidase